MNRRDLIRAAISAPIVVATMSQATAVPSGEVIERFWWDPADEYLYVFTDRSCYVWSSSQSTMKYTELFDPLRWGESL